MSDCLCVAYRISFFIQIRKRSLHVHPVQENHFSLNAANCMNQSFVFCLEKLLPASPKYIIKRTGYFDWKMFHNYLCSLRISFRLISNVWSNIINEKVVNMIYRSASDSSPLPKSEAECSIKWFFVCPGVYQPFNVCFCTGG